MRITNLHEQYLPIANEWVREVLGYTDLNDAAENGVTVLDFEECYEGIHETTADFSEEYAVGLLDDVPTFISRNIDWNAVWDYDLTHEFAQVYFNNTLHIFRQQ